MKKRAIAMLLAAGMIFNVVGCGNSSGENDTVKNGGDSSQNQDNEAQGADTSGDTVSFTFYTHGVATSTDIPKYQEEVLAEVNKKLQQDLGFTADIHTVSYADDVFAEKVLLDLSGKKTIDFIRFTQPSSQLADLYGKHMILDLTEYIDQAKNLKENIPADVWKEVSSDGKILAIPMPVFQTTTTGWVRGDLVAEAGLDAITTFSEFETFLKYVKSTYPDKTPYVAPLTNIESYLLGYFTETPIAVGVDTPGGFVDADGTIKPKIYDPGYRDFIAKLAEWYEDGLIDDSIFNLDENQVIDIFGKDIAGAVGANIWQQQYGTLAAVTEANPDWNISFLSPLSDAKKYPSSGLATEFLALSATSENPEKAVQFADWCMYNEENYWLVTAGIEGKTYEIASEGDYEIMKAPQSEGDTPMADLFQSLFPGYNGSLNMKYSAPGVPAETVRAYKECSSIRLDKVYVPATSFYSIEIPTDVSLSRQDADAMVLDEIQAMIQGRQDLSHWDDMLKTYEDMGGLAQYQMYTDAMNQ